MAAVLDAILSLKAKVEGEPAVQRLGQEIGALGRQAKGAVGGLQGMAGNVTGLSGALSALVPMLSIGGIAALGNQAIETGDKFWDLSQRTGVSVEALAKFGKAAKLNGTDVDGVAKALQKLSKGMMDAATKGTGPAADALRMLGISAVDASGQLRGADEVMLEIADRFKTMPDGAQKTALALQLFGKSGAEIIPMLNEGSAAIEKLSTRMSTTFAQRADEYNDRLTMLSGAVNNLGIAVAEQLLPTLIDGSDQIINLISDLQKWVDTNATGVEGAARVVSAVVQIIGAGIGFVLGNVAALSRALGRLFAGDFAGAAQEWQNRINEIGKQAVIDFTNIGNTINGTANATTKASDAAGKMKQQLAAMKNEQEEAKQKQAEWNAYIQQTEMEYSRLHFTISQTKQALDGQTKIMDARVAAEVAVNNAAKTGLQIKLQNAKTDEDKLAITQRIANIDISNARLQLQLSNAQEQATLKQVQLKIQDAKLDEAKAAAELAAAKARGIATAQYEKALQAQVQVVQAAIDEYEVARQIVPLKEKAAQATYDAAVMQAKANVEAMKNQIQQNAAATASAEALNNIRQIPSSLDSAASAADRLASGLESSAKAAAQFSTLGTGRISLFGTIPNGQQITQFATGGFVTGPTAAIVGEGGESEYIIPASKMAAASSNYLAGARGAGVLSGSSSPAQINITTGPVLQANGETWVTVKDLERAMRTTADSVLSRVRTPAARRVLGIR